MLLDQLVAATHPWAAFYGNSPVIQSAVGFGHFAGIVVSGGMAFATDRTALHLVRSGREARRRHLEQASGVHRYVILGLGVTMLSGFLMLAADLEYFAASPFFWIKMGLLGLLLINGMIIVRQERILQKAHPGLMRPWRRLKYASITSLTLWFAVVLAGVTMTNL